MSTLLWSVLCGVLLVVALPFEFLLRVIGYRYPEHWAQKHVPCEAEVMVRVDDRERGNCAVIMALLLLGVVVLIGLAGFMGGNDVWAVLQGLYKGSVGG